MSFKKKQLLFKNLSIPAIMTKKASFNGKNFLTIGEFSNRLGVCTKTIRRWESQRKIHVQFRTIGGHRRFSLDEVDRAIRGIKFQKHERIKRNRAFIYARVSSQRQKEDLERQIELLVKKAETDSCAIMSIYKDIGSGLNDNRQGLLRLIRDCYKHKDCISSVYITFRDRLARFGTKVLEEFLSFLKIELKVINENIKVKDQDKLLEEFIQDFVSIFTSFTGRWYVMRKKWKHLSSSKL